MAVPIIIGDYYWNKNKNKNRKKIKFGKIIKPEPEFKPEPIKQSYCQRNPRYCAAMATAGVAGIAAGGYYLNKKYKSNNLKKNTDRLNRINEGIEMQPMGRSKQSIVHIDKPGYMHHLKNVGTNLSKGAGRIKSGLKKLGKHANNAYDGIKSKLSKFGNTECGICTDENNQNSITLRCGHQFLQDCICQWFRTGNTCPICRAAYKPSQIVQYCPGNPKRRVVKGLFNDSANVTGAVAFGKKIRRIKSEYKYLLKI